MGRGEWKESESALGTVEAAWGVEPYQSTRGWERQRERRRGRERSSRFICVDTPFHPYLGAGLDERIQLRIRDGLQADRHE